MNDYIDETFLRVNDYIGRVICVFRSIPLFPEKQFAFFNPEAYLYNKTCFNAELVPSAKSICHLARSFEPRRAATLKNSLAKKVQVS